MEGDTNPYEDPNDERSVTDENHYVEVDSCRRDEEDSDECVSIDTIYDVPRSNKPVLLSMDPQCKQDRQTMERETRSPEDSNDGRSATDEGIYVEHVICGSDEINTDPIYDVPRSNKPVLSAMDPPGELQRQIKPKRTTESRYLDMSHCHFKTKEDEDEPLKQGSDAHPEERLGSRATLKTMEDTESPESPPGPLVTIDDCSNRDTEIDPKDEVPGPSMTCLPVPTADQAISPERARTSAEALRLSPVRQLEEVPLSTSDIFPSLSQCQYRERLSNQTSSTAGTSGYLSSLSFDRVSDNSEGLSSAIYEGTCYLKVYYLVEGVTRKALETCIQKAGVDLDTIRYIIMQRHDQSALLEFDRSTSPDSALDLLQKKRLSLGGNQLHISKYYPDIDPQCSFLTGLASDTKPEMLESAIAEMGVTVFDIYMGRAPSVAMLVYKSSSDKRVVEEQAKDKEIIVNGSVVKFRLVERPLCVLITASHVLKESRDKICKHLNGFERRVRVVDWGPDNKQLLAEFINSNNITEVCNTPEVNIDGTVFHFEPYYQCLDLDPTLSPLPEHIELKGPQKYRALFSNESAYKDKFQKILERKRGSLYKKDDRCFVLCNVDLMETRVTQKTERWAENCLKELENFWKGFVVFENVHVDSECFTEVISMSADFERFKEHLCINLSVMDLCNDDNHFSIVGEKKPVQAFMDTLHKKENTIPTVTKKKKLRNCEGEIVKHVLKSTDAKLGNDIQKIENYYIITYKGSRSDVESKLSQLYEMLGKIVTKCITGYNSMKKDLLQTSTISDYLKEKFKLKRIVASYEVTESGVLVCCQKIDELGQAMNILQTCIQTGTHKLPSNRADEGDEWQLKLSELYRKYGGFFMLEITQDDLKLIGADKHFEYILNDVLMFFDSFAIVNTFFEIDNGSWRYLQANQKEYIGRIKEIHKNVDIAECEDEIRKGFTIRGKKSDCKQAFSSLQKLIDTMLYRRVLLKEAHLHEIIHEKENMRELIKIEFETKCGLNFATCKNVCLSIPIEIASVQVGCQNIVVTAGDITEMIVDAIVCPCDRSLQNMAGIAAAISYKVGPDFQLVCDETVLSKGELEYGQLYILDPKATLPCKHVLMVAVPHWIDGNHNEEVLLKQAIQNCLRACQKKGIKTVIIPTLDSTFNFPPDVAIRAITEGIFVTRENDSEQNELKPETVFLFAHSPEARYYLLKALKDKSETGYRTTLADTSIEVTTIQGELATQNVEVIVNSCTHDLNLYVGALPKSLVKEGGDTLQQECKVKYPDGITRGQIAVTSGANLKCKYVFHGVLDKWDGGQGHAEKIMGYFVTECLQKASDLWVNSIAFPAFGTGRMGFEPQFVARLINDCVYTFKCRNPSTALRQVIIVAWPGDHNTLQGFKSEMENLSTDISGHPCGRFRSFAPDIFTDRSNFKKSYDNNVSVEICQGDITKETTVAIVNSVFGLDLDTEGAVSKAIFKAAGPSIQMECNSSENKDSILKRGFAVTGGGYLTSCRHIFHLKVKGSKGEWRTSIDNCLKEADHLGITSLAFPALGTGSHATTPAIVADAMFSAIANFARKGAFHLHRIRIVIFEKNMLDTFVTEASKSAEDRRSFKTLSRGLPRLSIAHAPRRDSDEKIAVQLYGDSEDQLSAGEDQLKSLFSKATIKLGPKLFARITSREGYTAEREKKLILKIAKDNLVHLELNQPNQEICIDGWHRYVTSAKLAVNQYLDNLHW